MRTYLLWLQVLLKKLLKIRKMKVKHGFLRFSWWPLSPHISFYHELYFLSQKLPWLLLVYFVHIASEWEVCYISSADMFSLGQCVQKNSNIHTLMATIGSVICYSIVIEVIQKLFQGYRSIITLWQSNSCININTHVLERELSFSQHFQFLSLINIFFEKKLKIGLSRPDANWHPTLWRYTFHHTSKWLFHLGNVQ